MSTVYDTEPAPTARAVIHTTLGDILVELFAKQTPLTCRNFLQLSLDGYYDGTIFHRLVPNFILQGGDPTGTGNGGESVYDGASFADEFHSRLSFRRRGLLGMANEGRPDTNGSQFFFTLGKTEELNGKNTLFGRVAGDTIYNLVKIGESEVQEGSERPIFPIMIQSISILENPFDDMVKRTRVATQAQPKAPAAKDKRKKRKGGKQLLSFGDDEDDEVEPAFKKTKFDTRLIADEEAGDAPSRGKKPPRMEKTRGDKPSKTAADEDRGGPPEDTEPEGKEEHEPKARARPEEPSPERTPSPPPPKKSALEMANEELAAIKASMRRTIHSEQPVEAKEKSALESMIPENSIRGRKRRPGGSNATGSDDTAALRMLKAFQSRLDKAPPERDATQSSFTKDEGDGGAPTAPEGEAELCDLHFIANCQSCTAWDKQEKDESDDEGWMSHSLSFAADKLGKDLSNRKKAEEELVVIDPREKARTLKEEKRVAREAQAGGSGRAWDQARDRARNAQLARATSLAGRGAR